MRKFLFHILLLVSMASYAQTVNVMRYSLLGSTPGRSYLVSCVDSILHDMENQLHVLYVSDTAYPIPLADIYSVTFSKEPSQCIHVPGYAGNASAWLFTDGAAMSLSPDTALAGYRHLLIDSLDLSRGTWTSTGRVSICLDSQYRPVVAIDGEHKMRFSYDTDGTFSVSVLHTDSTTEDVTSLSAMRGWKRTRHRSAATTMDSLCHALDVYCAAKEYVGSQPSVLVRGIASSLSESLGKEFPDDFGSLVVGGEPLASSVVDFLTGRFRSASSGSAGWTEAMASSDNATAEYCRWVVDQELDDCTATVVSADVEGRNDIVLKYMFSGDRFFDSGKPLPAYAIIYSRVDESFAQYTTGTREIHEGFESRVFEDCSGAVYTFRIVMWPSSCAEHGDLFVRTSNSKAAVVAPLYLSQLEQESASTSDSLLTVRMKVAVEYQTDKDRVQLSRWDYGVYVKQGDADSVLYSAKNTGNSGYIDLEFCRSELNMDYTAFRATPKEPIYFGVYTTEAGDITRVYDRQQTDIVYSEAPEAITGEVVDVSSTEATVNCEYKNCQFWNARRGLEYFTDSKSEPILLDTNKEDGEYDFHLDNLTANTTYNYRAYYAVNGTKSYGETKTFKTKGAELCPDHNHPHMIDLGLPSGTKWACCNVGTSVPEGYGGYYAWGETEEKNNYTPLTYKYCNDRDGNGWCSGDEYQNIGSNISGTSYDVAHVKWGGGWRMPTRDEIKELCEKCSWEWTTVNGIRGYKVTGPNGNSIFLPAAGERLGTEVGLRGSYGYYWSGSLYEDYRAYCLLFYSGYGLWLYWWYGRNCGYTVRPVTDK